jgi:hypothetical protein
MKFFEKPYAETSWDEVNHVVKTTFKGYMSSEQFREVYDNIIDCCNKFRADKTLCDCRNYVTIRPEDQKWLTENWAPRLQRAGVKKTALILPENAIQKQVIDKTTKTAEAVSDSIGTFGNLEAAMAWIKK